MSVKPALTAEEWAAALEASGTGRLERLPEPRGPHATAATALHGQPFGFTWEMLDNTALGLVHFDTANAKECVIVPREQWNAIADRIAALLPPRGTPS